MARHLVDQLKAKGVKFDRGLSDAECLAVESRFGFRFPADLRAFLETALPRGPGWPDWRGDELSLRNWLSSPLEGILFDVESGGFWLPEWGERPSTLDGAKEIVTNLVLGAPRLIPIYRHRMMPDDPRDAGNPVFSVHQTDIIHYGADLADYFRNEFHLTESPSVDGVEIRPIRFWDLDRFQAVRWEKPSWVFDNRAL